MTGPICEIRVRVADYAVAVTGTITTIGLGSCVAIALYDATARVERITAKIAGGASMFGGLLPAGGINIGERNVIAVRQALAGVKVAIVGEDTGSDYGRSVFLDLEDGRLEVRSIRRGSRVL